MFSGFLLQEGFSNSKADASLFTLNNAQAITLILVYVDDILETGSNDEYITELITLLGSKICYGRPGNT